jgi:hypothetical protein
VNRQLLFLGVFMFAFCGMTADDHARGGIPIPIVFGHDEEMTEMGDLPPEKSRAVAEELGTQVTVAFLYERVQLYYLDLWTWNGRHVLHSGDRYWEPDSTGWQNMIGGEPSAKYGKPILYRIPLLSALLVVVVIGYVMRKQFFKTDQEQLEALMNDKRYQRSIETIFGKSSGEESAEAITTLDEQRFLNAKNQLIGGGVAAHTAEANLRKIADAILANTNSTIDAYLRLASQLDQQGEWDKSAAVYSQVISSLPDADDRKVYARNCLTSANEKRSANAAEKGDCT